jgi:uncharacterized protein with GYD domain
MPTFIMLTRLSPEALTKPEQVEELNRQVEDRIKRELPEVRWIANYAVLGGVDYVDIFEAPDGEAATKVAMLIRTYGHGTTETWFATPWDRFLELMQGLGS